MNRRKFEGQDMAGIVITLATMIAALLGWIGMVATLIYLAIRGMS